MKNYECYSLSALTMELENIKKIKFLVEEMSKPDNFTYMDIVNLQGYMNSLEDEFKHMINVKKNIGGN